MRRNIWYRVRGYLAAGLALIACPCHLVVTLPLILSVTAGTGVGVYIKQNLGVVIAVSIIAFIGGLALASRWLRSGVSEGVASSKKQFQIQMNRPTQPPFLQQEKGGKEL
jgi:mercuric ion transport protein